MADVMKQLKKKVDVLHTLYTSSLCCSQLIMYLQCCVSAENCDDSGPENRENQEEEEGWGESIAQALFLV